MGRKESGEEPPYFRLRWLRPYFPNMHTRSFFETDLNPPEWFVTQCQAARKPFLGNSGRPGQAGVAKGWQSKRR